MKTDVLFITRSKGFAVSGAAGVYRDLNLEIGGETADFPLLRALARREDFPVAREHAEQDRRSFRLVSVLTPFYLEDYLARRGLSFLEIASVEEQWDELVAHIENGVSLIALSTTWLPPVGNAQEIRRIVARLRTVAGKTPIVVGGMAVRKAVLARRLLDEGQIKGVLPDWMWRVPGVRRIAQAFTLEALSHHFLLMDAQADAGISAVICADGGEATLAAMAERVKRGLDYSDLPGLALPRPSGYIFTDGETPRVDVDAELVDWRKHYPKLVGGEVPISCGTGCPMRCGFCDFPSLQRLGLRSAASMVEELTSLAQVMPAPRRVYLVGDNLSAGRRRLLELAKALSSARLELRWRAFLRADVLDDELACALRESGCAEALLGIESGDPEILRKMDKKLDPDKALQGIHALDRQGISTFSTFVVGFPGESARSCEQTASFISSLPSGARANAFHSYHLFRFLVSPTAPIAAPSARKLYNLRGIGENWRHSTMDVARAAIAMRRIFVDVKGPSHAYMEPLPEHWPIASVRQVAEARDVLQKQRLAGETPPIEKLLDLVRAAESNATASSLSPLGSSA